MSAPLTFRFNLPPEQAGGFVLDTFTLASLAMLKAADDVRRAECSTLRLSPSDRVRLVRAGIVALLGLLKTATENQLAELLRFFDEVSAPFLLDYITPKPRGGLRSVP